MTFILPVYENLVFRLAVFRSLMLIYREKILALITILTRVSSSIFGPGVRLGGSVGRAPAHRAGDPGSNLGPGESFSL